MNSTAELLRPEIHTLLQERRFRDLRDALAPLESADVADILAALDSDEDSIAFRVLSRDHAGEVLANLDPDTQASLLSGLSHAAVRAFEEMEPDDRADLLDELPADLARRLIQSLSPAERRQTQLILGYPPESAGRLMTPHYVRVRPEWSARQAIEHVRRWGEDAETILWVYVIDANGKLIDDLTIRSLLLADPDDNVESLMDNEFIAIHASDDQEEAVVAMNRYDRTVLPVIDSAGGLLGIVTFDDVADVAEEEATEDIHKLGGMEALDTPYMRTTLADMLKKRGGWLCGLLILQVLTIGVLDAFEGRLNQATILIVFIPLIISAGGNTGTQAASLLIRALALREIELSNWAGVLRRELVTGAVLGVLLGSIAFGVVVGLDALGMTESSHATLVGVTVGASIVAIVIWGVLLGAAFPMLLERLKLDPATISSPLVATMMDVSGLVIYLLIARRAERHTAMTRCIRDVAERDYQAVCALVNHFIEHTSVHFATQPVCPDDLRRNLEGLGDRYPFLIAHDPSNSDPRRAFLGFARASRWRERAAYDNTAESAIYIAEHARGGGLGLTLYRALFDALRDRGFHTVVAGATLPNDASIALHRKAGFEPVGVFREVGHKFDKWHDVMWWQKLLSPALDKDR